MNKIELSNKIASIQAEVKSILDNNPESMSTSDFDKIQGFNEEIKSLNAQVKQLDEVARIREEVKAYDANTANVLRLPNAAPQVKEFKSLGSAIMSTLSKGKSTQTFNTFDFDVKTLFSTSAGWSAPLVRSNEVVLSPTRPLTLLDYLASRPIAQGSSGYRYMMETTFTNNAAEVAEGGTYSDEAFALTEEVVSVRKIGTSIAVTDEQLADVPMVEDYLTNRMSYGVRLRLENQILSGNGTTPNIQGITQFSGVLTTAKGATTTETVLNALYDGITQIRIHGYANPNLIVLHPQDWQAVRTSVSTQGQPIFQDPKQPDMQMVFGIPVIVSTVATYGTAIIMDTTFVSVLYNQGLEFQMTNSHANDFLAGQQRIRASVRAGLELSRATAVCTVTNLNG